MGYEYCPTCGKKRRAVCDICSYVSFHVLPFFELKDNVVCKDCFAKLDKENKLELVDGRLSIKKKK